MASRVAATRVRAKAELLFLGVFQPKKRAGAGDRPEGARPEIENLLEYFFENVDRFWSFEAVEVQGIVVDDDFEQGLPVMTVKMVLGVAEFQGY